jgi:hypothetical protein
MDSADLEKSLARVMENGAITYTLASLNEGETFQSLTIDGKTLVTYVITEEDDPDPAKTREDALAARGRRLLATPALQGSSAMRHDGI